MFPFLLGYFCCLPIFGFLGISNVFGGLVFSVFSVFSGVFGVLRVFAVFASTQLKLIEREGF